MDDEVDAGDGNAVAVWPKTKCERVQHTLTHTHIHTLAPVRVACAACLRLSLRMRESSNVTVQEAQALKNSANCTPRTKAAP